MNLLRLFPLLFILPLTLGHYDENYHENYNQNYDQNYDEDDDITTPAMPIPTSTTSTTSTSLPESNGENSMNTGTQAKMEASS